MIISLLSILHTGILKHRLREKFEPNSGLVSFMAIEPSITLPLLEHNKATRESRELPVHTDEARNFPVRPLSCHLRNSLLRNG
ncbi:hypothetical protein [Thiolapillus sp.]|uniref:hypothetical protein n=1 Tax=Thiolapillus sp. TaxID=2017437 RepID=UPI0025D2CA9C|nr:hypothetical protein [Thiolapillus sp.]